VTDHLTRARSRSAAASALFALALAVVATDASALARTFVASFGSDSNPCSLALPCRGFTVALAVTDPGGEIVVLDSAGYGAVTIAKSVSIVVPAGIYAGISVLSGDGVTVVGIGISVTLRGLTINGQGGMHGIRYIQGARLNVANCEINGMGGDGLRVEGVGTVVVTRTSILGSAQEGLYVGAAANVSVARSRIQSSGGNGIQMGGGAVGSVTRTVVSNNGLFGVEALQTTAGSTRLAIDDATITDNAATGIYAEGSGASAFAKIDVRDSLVARNANGIYAVSLGGGRAAIGSTRNDVTDNLQSGIATVSGGGGTTTLRTSRNGVFGNQVGGLLQSSPSLFTAGDNYVRDNQPGDNFGAQSDSLM
jgi:Right handed beta helix region